jgi:hypothetical protein
MRLPAFECCGLKSRYNDCRQGLQKITMVATVQRAQSGGADSLRSSKSCIAASLVISIQAPHLQ